MTLRKKTLANTVAKRRNAGNKHCLFSPQCFLLSKREILILSMYNLLSANAFNLIQSKKNCHMSKSESVWLEHSTKEPLTFSACKRR